MIKSTDKPKFERTDGGHYLVKLDGDRIGWVGQEPSGRWKAVDGYMAWMRRYKTRARARAATALVKHWREVNQ